jgi:hypothetical protein
MQTSTSGRRAAEAKLLIPSKTFKLLHLGKKINLFNRRNAFFTHNRGYTCAVKAVDRDAEPDWEEEMSIFKKRSIKPNQLAVLRKIEEEKVDVGRVSIHSPMHTNH